MKPHVSDYKSCALNDSLFVRIDQRENRDLVKTCPVSRDLVMAEQSKDGGPGPLVQGVFHIEFTTVPGFIANEDLMSVNGHGELRNVSHDGRKWEPAC